jgi:hypothetical protein
LVTTEKANKRLCKRRKVDEKQEGKADRSLINLPELGLVEILKCLNHTDLLAACQSCKLTQKHVRHSIFWEELFRFHCFRPNQWWKVRTPPQPKDWYAEFKGRFAPNDFDSTKSAKLTSIYLDSSELDLKQSLEKNLKFSDHIKIQSARTSDSSAVVTLSIDQNIHLCSTDHSMINANLHCQGSAIVSISGLSLTGNIIAAEQSSVTLRDCDVNGMLVVEDNAEVDCRYCKFRDSSTSGIHITDRSAVQLEHCGIYSNSENGIVVQKKSECHVMNSLVTGNLQVIVNTPVYSMCYTIQLEIK